MKIFRGSIDVVNVKVLVSAVSAFTIILSGCDDSNERRLRNAQNRTAQVQAQLAQEEAARQDAENRLRAAEAAEQAALLAQTEALARAQEDAQTAAAAVAARDMAERQALRVRFATALRVEAANRRRAQSRRLVLERVAELRLQEQARDANAQHEIEAARMRAANAEERARASDALFIERATALADLAAERDLLRRQYEEVSSRFEEAAARQGAERQRAEFAEGKLQEAERVCQNFNLRILELMNAIGEKEVLLQQKMEFTRALEEELTYLRSQTQRGDEERQDLVERLADAESKAQRLMQDLAALETSARASLSEERGTRAQLEDQLEKLTSMHRTSLETLGSVHEQQCAALSREHEEQIHGMSEALGDAERAIAEWNTRAGELKQEIEMLQAQLDAATEQSLRLQDAAIVRTQAQAELGARTYIDFYKSNLGRLVKNSPAAKQALRNLLTRLTFGLDPDGKISVCTEAFQQLMANKDVRSLLSKVTTGLKLREGKTYASLESVLDFCFDKSHEAQAFNNTLAAMVAPQSPKGMGADQSKPFSIEDVIRFLDAKHEGSRGSVWDVDQVSLGEHWLVSSPYYHDAERTRLDSAHSQHFHQAWGGVIASATHFVDITTLAEPQQVFIKTLKASLKALDEKQLPITVRILFGTHRPWTVQAVNPTQLLRVLTDELDANTKLQIFVSYYDASLPVFGQVKAAAAAFGYFGDGPQDEKPMSWNHSKIVAADGNLLFTGGHNLFDTYQDLAVQGSGSLNPVHDVSVSIPGRLARVGHEFSNRLWQFACEPKAGSVAGYSGVFSFKSEGGKKKIENAAIAPRFSEADVIAKDYDLHSKPEPVIAIGRLGNIGRDPKGDKVDDVSDSAIPFMIQRAEKSVLISQQAAFYLFTPTQFNNHVIESVAQALIRGVDVYILTSSTDETYVGKGNDNYSSKANRDAGFFNVYDLLKRNSINSDANTARLFKHLHLLSTANRNHEVPNHAKVVIVDGKVSYIGSHNVYDDSHAEFGAIFGESKSRELITDYFSGLWHASAMTGKGPSLLETEINVGDYVYVKKAHHAGNFLHSLIQTDRAGGSDAAALTDSLRSYESFDFISSTDLASGSGPRGEGSLWSLARVLQVTGDDGVEVDLDFLSTSTDLHRTMILPRDQVSHWAN